MNKIPPIAAVEAKGPLGVVQLPRLWSKVLLHKKGLLPETYLPCGDGLDRLVLEGLGLKRDVVVNFLENQLPSYPEFERFVLEQLGGSVPAATIAAVNDTILTRLSPRRDAILREAGLSPNLPEQTSHVLNRYDDWTEFHKHLIGIE